MEKYKKIWVQGKLKTGNTIHWFEDKIKLIEPGVTDFMFILIDDGDAFDRYKYIQDNNELHYLKITKIEVLESEYQFLH